MRQLWFSVPPAASDPFRSAEEVFHDELQDKNNIHRFGFDPGASWKLPIGFLPPARVYVKLRMEKIHAHLRVVIEAKVIAVVRALIVIPIRDGTIQGRGLAPCDSRSGRSP